MSRPRLWLLALPILAFAGTAALWAATVKPAGKAPARPKRIVSLNLCTDQLLIALADRDQIAGLTRNATDTQLSAAAAEARSLPVLGNSAEEILAIDPDLVIGAPARRSAALGILQTQHYKTLDLKSPNGLDKIFAAIRKVAAAVGHPERGEALIAGMQRDLAAIGKPGRGRIAAYYQREGFMTGTGTLVDDLMRRVGLVNLAGTLHKPALSQMSLEEMVAAQPDFLMIESGAEHVTDQGTEMLHHPALDGIPRLNVPQAWTVCGGPAYVKAARRLAEQIARHP